MKLNLKTITGILGSSLLIQTALAVDGTGVGSGGDGVRDQQIVKITIELVGGSGSKKIDPVKSKIEDLRSWCTKASSILRREFAFAQAFIDKNDLATANQKMTDALIAVNESVDASKALDGPMMMGLARRGVMMIRALDATLPAGDRLTLVTKSDFLVRYIQFILDTQRDLEDPYYPYYRHDRCNDCDGLRHVDIRVMERMYLEIAVKELQFTKTFADIRRGVVTPVGAPGVFLKISELISSYVAEDLSENLFAAAHACSIRDLDDLSKLLQSYNDSGSPVFPDERRAVRYTYEEVSRIAENVDLAKDCR